MGFGKVRKKSDVKWVGNDLERPSENWSDQKFDMETTIWMCSTVGGNKRKIKLREREEEEERGRRVLQSYRRHHLSDSTGER